MKVEKSRQVKEDGSVVIQYEDGTKKVIHTPKEAPENVKVDAKRSTGKGHSFTEEELKERGYA